MRRKEDLRLLMGAGRFTDDFNLKAQAYAAMVRSPYPHAKILRIDSGAARAMAGVLGVYSGADCVGDGLRPIPHNPLPSTRDDMKLTGPGGGGIFEGPHRLLPVEKALHVGEAVAMVVAEARDVALDAAEVVEIEYQELPWVTHSEDALKGGRGAPSVWDEAPLPPFSASSECVTQGSSWYSISTTSAASSATSLASATTIATASPTWSAFSTGSSL